MVNQSQPKFTSCSLSIADELFGVETFPSLLGCSKYQELGDLNKQVLLVTLENKLQAGSRSRHKSI